MRRAALSLLLALAFTQPGCGRVRDWWEDRKEQREERKYMAIRNQVFTALNDPQGRYRCVYELDEAEVATLLQNRAQFRTIDATHYELEAWMKSDGGFPFPEISCVLDTRKRRIVCESFGSEVYRIDELLGPLQADRIEKLPP